MPQKHLTGMLDLSKDEHDSLRFGTCSFPDEAPLVIYEYIGNETHKV